MRRQLRHRAVLLPARRLAGDRLHGARRRPDLCRLQAQFPRAAALRDGRSHPRRADRHPRRALGQGAVLELQSVLGEAQPSAAARAVERAVDRLARQAAGVCQLPHRRGARGFRRGAGERAVGVSSAPRKPKSAGDASPKTRYNSHALSGGCGRCSIGFTTSRLCCGGAVCGRVCRRLLAPCGTRSRSARCSIWC